MMLKLFLVLLLIENSYQHEVEDEPPIVNTTLGILRGTYKASDGGRLVIAFEGIPYAKAPVGELRFEPPKDPEPWLGIWDANTLYYCMQFDFGQRVVGDEDCLYLNIYYPFLITKTKKLLDVLVHIHGGAFMVGHSNIGPDYFMDKDILVISVNYRLGILGFLSTEDQIVPGNNGLKDQVKALQWIKENIENFGGNPDSITITGVSAGGVSTHFHFLSPMSKGLFHRGISQSGTVLLPWSIQEAALEKTKKIGTAVGCETESTELLVKCLKKRPGRQIVQKVKLFQPFHAQPFAPFAPVVEKYQEGAFISDDPYDILKNGKINDVPWLVSFTKVEGTWPGVLLFYYLDELEERWDEVIPYILDFNYTISSNQKEEICKKIKEHYLKQTIPSTANFADLFKLFGDRHFYYGMEKAIRMHVKVSKSPVYLYLFDYPGSVTINSLFLKNNEKVGIGHGDDMPYLYKLPLFGNLTETDKWVKSTFVHIHTIFAKNGYPDLDYWKPVGQSDDLEFMHFKGPEDRELDSLKELAPTEFWDSLPIKENQNKISIKDEL